MSNIRYSDSTKGFYLVGMHQTIPEDVIEVSETLYATLMQGLRDGKEIYMGGSHPDVRYPVLSEAQKWVEVHAERNRLLRRTDWTQLPDVALTGGQVADWTTYRADLRAVLEQEDPFDITWPTPPGDYDE